MVEAGHTLHTTEGDHTLLTAGMDHIPPTIGGDHTHLTTEAGIVQGLHTATEDGGHLLFRYTTVGAGIDLSPSHPVFLQGPEGGAIPAVYHHRGSLSPQRSYSRSHSPESERSTSYSPKKGSRREPSRSRCSGKRRHSRESYSHSRSSYSRSMSRERSA